MKQLFSMKHLKTLKVGLMTFVMTFSFTGLKAQHTYINQHKNLANELSKKYGIPSSVILAVAFVESGGGTSKNSKVLKNHFGIVGKNTVSKSQYRSFNSVRASYEAFCKLITRKKYYARIKGSNDHKSWIEAIASAGYSTQPTEWKRRINLIINKFKLNNLR